MESVINTYEEGDKDDTEGDLESEPFELNDVGGEGFEGLKTVRESLDEDKEKETFKQVCEHVEGRDPDTGTNGFRSFFIGPSTNNTDGDSTSQDENHVVIQVGQIGLTALGAIAVQGVVHLGGGPGGLVFNDIKVRLSELVQA